MARYRSGSLWQHWILTVLATAAVAAAAWALAPAVVRWQIQRQVAVYWPGKVTIDHVGLQPMASIKLLGIAVRDHAGAIRAVLPSVTVAVEDLAWDGPVAARVTIRGATLEAGTPEQAITLPVTMTGAVTVPHRGELHLDGWRVDYRGVPVAQDVTASLQSSDPGVRIDGPVGHLLGGRLEAKVLPGRGAFEGSPSGATVSADRISLAQIGRLLPVDEHVTNGTGALHIEVLRRPESGWTIGGRLVVADADLRGVGLTRKLCHFIGVEDLSPLAVVQAELTFEMAGTVATITRGHMASDLPEMAVEPGSRIDLATGQIEASIVLAAGAKLDALPLLHPVGTLVKNLTRLHIHGHWRDPEEALFSRD
jgi:hypothetical protein